MNRTLLVAPVAALSLLVVGAAPAAAQSLTVQKPCGCYVHQGHAAGNGPAPETPSAVTSFTP